MAASLEDEAEELLRSLIGRDGLETYQNHIKHVYTQQVRARAEKGKKTPQTTEVKKILLEGEPINHDDLQALIVDELEALQDRIKNGPTNDILTYWDGEEPYGENYCRDRIAASLTPYLDRYKVRAHTEGTMPGNKRCDLLNTHELIDVPIEIKGQWHGDIWTAGEKQLSNYSREYRADGRGVYLVLWFGYLESGNSKNPRGWRGRKLPRTLEQMQSYLGEKYANISEKTKIIVLDLSRSE